MSANPPRNRAGTLAWPFPGLGAGAWRDPSWLAGLAIAALRRAIAQEQARRTGFLWLPVAFATGIALYFAANSEPNFAYALTLALMATTAGIGLGPGRAAGLTCIGLAALAFGFVAASWRTEQVAAPFLTQGIIAPLSGIVEIVEERVQGPRLTIRVETLGDLPQDRRPVLVRASLRSASGIRPGDHITATARLLPPPQAARPGGYDFAREAFFQQIGAVGSIVGTVRISAAKAQAGLQQRFWQELDRARNDVTRRIADAYGGQGGAVAAALVTGKRGLIDEPSNDALRAAGIYHIVSISGLHLALAAGAIFWLVRASLALAPAIALAWPVKKIAALAAMAGATAYCIFAGSEVATQRSLIMTLVMLGAILVDRPALSMRNLAISALIVLTREPETLLGPSFQMSFAAVAALVAFCEPLTRRLRPHDSPVGDSRQPARDPFSLAERLLRALWVSGVVLIATTLLASLATGPIGVYHFQTINPFGLIGNALALPFVSLIVMPSAVAGVLLYPLGLDAPVWWLMGAATAKVVSIADFVAAFDGSRLVVPATGPATLVLTALALACACLLTTWLRLIAVLPLLGSLAAGAAAPRPDLYVDREAAGVALRGPEGRLTVLGRPSEFVLGQWLAADGDGRKPSDPALQAGTRCDRSGCVGRLPDGRAVAYVLRPDALHEDCARAAILVTRLRAPPNCRALVLDREHLARNGAMTVRLAADGAFILNAARNPAVSRPWLAPLAGAAPPPSGTAATDSASAPSATDPANQPTLRDKTPSGSGILSGKPAYNATPDLAPDPPDDRADPGNLVDP